MIHHIACRLSNITLKTAFLEFVHNLPFYGLLVACIDDPVVRSMLAEVKRPVLTYGFDADADFQAFDEQQDAISSSFVVRRKQHGNDLKIQINMPGRHNVLNTLAAVAIASDEGISDSDIVAGLKSFAGVSRRFEVHGEFEHGQGRFTLVDDYGHHPSEVRAVIEAVRRGWPNERLVMVYQPHRYSRTLELFDQFVDVLSQVDVLVLLDTYAAGETPIAGAGAGDLYKQLRLRANVDITLLEAIDDVPVHLEQILRSGDFVITQGAGETAKLASSLKQRWMDKRVMP